MIARRTGDWWKDERRHWCAYCGDKLAPKAQTPTGRFTRDHVIPRKHKGRHITIPACQPCNAAKADKGLPEFMLTPYFQDARGKARPHRWLMRDLWLVIALAAVHQAKDTAD